MNILYWNIHNCGGVGQKTAYEQSSKDIINLLDNIKNYSVDRQNNEKLKIKVNDINDVDIIIFTEAYPQRTDKTETKIGNWNMILKDELYKRNFDLYEENLDYYNEQYLNQNCIAIYVNNKKHIVNNTEIKYSFTDSFPDCKIVEIKDLGVTICGVRIKNCIYENRKKNITGERQIENLHKYLQDIRSSKIIILGDFNFSSAYNKDYYIKNNDDINNKINFLNMFNEKSILNHFNINLTENGGSYRTRTSKDINGRYLQEIYNDAMLCNFESKINFYKLVTTEQMYCNNKYIDVNDGHIKNQYLYQPHIMTNGEWQVLLKEPIPHDFYLNNIMNIVYGSKTMITAPYPDHNLLFASVEV